MRNATSIEILLLVTSFFGVPLNAQADTFDLIAQLHASAPTPCIAKALDDRSSGIANFPDGKTDEELRGIMGGLAAMFLAAGASRMSSKNTQVVYTAVFYEGQPINEIGIYGYKFAEAISPSMFTAHEGLNGELFVIAERLLILLWHENYEKTSRCYEALKERLAAAQ